MVSWYDHWLYDVPRSWQDEWRDAQGGGPVAARGFARVVEALDRLRRPKLTVVDLREQPVLPDGLLAEAAHEQPPVNANGRPARSLDETCAGRPKERTR